MKTPTSSSRKIRTLAECAAFLCFALALSYAESLLPIQFAIPIPGFKLGFANIAIVIAYYRLSPLCAASVSLCRTILSFILFTGVSQFFFSLSGAVLSFLILMITDITLGKKLSFIGISILMALAHNAGQLICASLLMHTSSVISYAPVLAAAGIICGALSGIILCAVPKTIYEGKVSVS